MKNTYDMDDQVTFYFVTYREKGISTPLIKAWTDDKVLLDFYLKFHNKKSFKVRTVKDSYKNVVTLINNSCIHDEIMLVNLITRHREAYRQACTRKPKNGITTVMLPLTIQEHCHVDDNAREFFSSEVDYSFINRFTNRLKGKYQKALGQIGLLDVVDQAIMNKPSKFVRSVEIDEVMILLRFFRGDFN